VQITVQLPDDLVQRPDPGREALEALSIEGYRSGALSHHEASQLLGLSRFEFDGFLKGRNVYDHAYGMADLEEDMDTQRRLDVKESAAG
jgi:predicted HTH domain antitoxin